jgi:ribonuclease P protein component
MLPHHRLRTPAEYAAVFAEPEQRLRGVLWMWLLRTRSTESLDSGRLGLAVARKHLPRAVARNRVKRIAREAFRASVRELLGCDVVLLTTQPRADSTSRTNKRLSKTQRAARTGQLEAEWKAWLKPRGLLLRQFKQELATLAARVATHAAAETLPSSSSLEEQG